MVDPTSVTNDGILHPFLYCFFLRDISQHFNHTDDSKWNYIQINGIHMRALLWETSLLMINNSLCQICQICISLQNEWNDWTVSGFPLCVNKACVCLLLAVEQTLQRDNNPSEPPSVWSVRWMLVIFNTRVVVVGVLEYLTGQTLCLQVQKPISLSRLFPSSVYSSSQWDDSKQLCGGRWICSADNVHWEEGRQSGQSQSWDSDTIRSCGGPGGNQILQQLQVGKILSWTFAIFSNFLAPNMIWHKLTLRMMEVKT